MKYTMDRSGRYGRSPAGDYILRRSPGTQFALTRAAQTTLRRIQARVPVESGELRSSGRVEYRGVKKTSGGEPRMVVEVTFYAPHALAVNKRTKFMTAGLGRPR
jgi:hypothetical protein